MAIMTVSVKDDVAKKFRKTAYAAYGRSKGSLGKAVTDALDAWADRQEHVSRTLEMLEKGLPLGRMLYRKREELHERASH